MKKALIFKPFSVFQINRKVNLLDLTNQIIQVYVKKQQLKKNLVGFFYTLPHKRKNSHCEMYISISFSLFVQVCRFCFDKNIIISQYIYLNLFWGLQTSWLSFKVNIQLNRDRDGKSDEINKEILWNIFGKPFPTY